MWKLFVSAPPPADARTGLPPSHLVPLLSSVAMKKKKRRRDRASLLVDSRSASGSHGYASPLQPPVISEPSRPAAAASRGRNEHAVPGDSRSVEPMRATQEAFVQSVDQCRPASRGNRSDARRPKSVNVVCYIVKRVCFRLFCWALWWKHGLHRDFKKRTPTTLWKSFIKKVQMSVIFDKNNCILSVHLHLQVTSVMLLRTTCSFHGNDSRRVGAVGWLWRGDGWQSILV